MLRAYSKMLLHKLASSIDGAVKRIDHNAVIKDLTGRADLTGSYLLMIVFSCLVALLGLLTNSVAVVIGAMLISPLMGPIFTAALAFALGDLRLAKMALKIIVTSILLSVLVATFFTLLSPLKAPTQEILSRTRPNIYDLLIAVFAGAAGAYALCTRVSYLFVTTGVAVATAVIPPLSVVGYGIGTGQLAIALGGFLLFFTNLVAIVISSDIVFHIFRFRASMVEEASYPVRKRAQILGAVLAIISVPLVYTLVTDIKNANLNSLVEQILKKNLDSKDYSRMTDFSFQREDNGVTVAASVNTVRFYNISSVKRIENGIKTVLKLPVRLDLEQVIVRSGRVEPQYVTSRVSLVTPPRPENLATLREKAIGRVKEGCSEAESFVKPYLITQCGIRFSDQEATPIVNMTLARDYPFSEEERLWMKIALEKKLGEPLVLVLETVPLLPPITFDEKGNPDEVSRKALVILKQFAENRAAQHIVITAPRSMSRVSKAHNNQESAAITAFLVKEIGIPPDRITSGPDHGSDYRVRVKPNHQMRNQVP